MKKTRIILCAILFGSFAAGLQSCKKDDLSMTNADPATDDAGSSTSRMWATGKQLYAAGHTQSGAASLYTLTAPGGGGLVPSLVAGFYNGGVQVTFVTGIAYYTPTNSIIISTHSSSNNASSLLTYPAGGPYTTPVVVSCADITDIEYNEYDGVLYGIELGTNIVSIDPVFGTITLDLAVAPGAGLVVKGLCNYNGLLSFSVSDNTGTADNFYSYSPGGSPGAALFTTDWGSGNGGMQYCNALGWVIISATDTKKGVNGSTYAVSGPAGMAGGPYFFSDLTSD